LVEGERGLSQQDILYRFLLPGAFARGAIIRGTHIIEEARDVHGLTDKSATLFGQSLLASVMLLCTSKGGIRQVLQLDASIENTPIRRIQAETQSGRVRGYVQWQEGPAQAMTEREGITALMGEDILLSTVRDLGVGKPYISTVQHHSDWLSDYVLEYLRQSVQVHADLILHHDLALMLEAMPGCDDEHWFKAVEAMAKVSDEVLQQDEPETILQAFDGLGCQVVGRDVYTYACSCSQESMSQALMSLSEDDLLELADEYGDVILSCSYCKNHAKLNVLKKDSER